MKTPRAVTASPNLRGGRIDLRWQNPPASDFAGGPPLSKIRVVRRSRTFPLTETDGDIIYDGPVVTGATDGAAAPLQSWFYTVFASDGSLFFADTGSRAEAFATADYGLADQLYQMLPAVHQRNDATLQPNDLASLAKVAPLAAAAFTALLPSVRALGQLRRFFRATFSSVDLMRSFAEGLRNIHDVERARPVFLEPLAQMLGWDLDRTLPVFAQRAEIRFAPGLYRTVGTIPNIRSLVTRYTGWYTQVAEFESQLIRANLPAELNIYAMIEGAAGWTGFDDAAPVLGFNSTNNSAAGTTTTAAELVGELAAPFALRPGMEIGITADNRIPVVARFLPGDFASISSATAPEVAAVMNRVFSEFTVTARGDGRLVLQSNSIGTTSSLDVEQSTATLVTLEGAPRGALSTCVDGLGRLRVFYEAAVARAVPGGAANQPPADAAPVLGFAADSLASGALTTLISPTSEPFALTSGMQLTLAVDGGVPATAVFRTAAFANIAAATAAEVASAINAAIGRGIASAVAGRLALQSPSAGAGSVRVFSAAAPPSVPLGRVRYKTFRNGAWGDSIGLLDPSAPAQAHPAAVIQANGKALAAWVENPDGPSARLRFTTEDASHVPQPALLSGHLTGPFAIVIGSRLTFRGNFPKLRGFQFAATDFANPLQATIAEVVTAINARLLGLAAFVQTNGTLGIETVAVGADQYLELVLGASTAAASLGFDGTNSVATGDAGDAIDWLRAQDVLAASADYRDLAAVTAADGTVFLFWAVHQAATWQIASARWSAGAWKVPEPLATSEGGNRQPCAVLDATNRIWLFWSHREGSGTPEDNWTIHRRVFDPVAAAWGAETPVTTVPTGGAADREPCAQLNLGALRVFFRSSRAGGDDIWSVNVDPRTGVATAPVQVTAGAAGNYSPAVLRAPSGASLLLIRSDRSVPISRVAAHPVPPVENRITLPPPAPPPYSQPLSVRAVDTGTERRFAGTTSVVPGDADRIGRAGLFDDLLAYTAQKPLGPPAETLAANDVYTRGTIGLYLSQVIPDSQLSRELIDRLAPVLDRFLPENVRAVVFLAPRLFAEDPITIQESFSDEFPFIEGAGAFAETVAAAMPNVSFLLANQATNVSANPADLTTLRRRSFFPPLV
jgi:hypothetical protein